MATNVLLSLSACLGFQRDGRRRCPSFRITLEVDYLLFLLRFSFGDRLATNVVPVYKGKFIPGFLNSTEDFRRVAGAVIVISIVVVVVVI